MAVETFILIFSVLINVFSNKIKLSDHRAADPRGRDRTLRGAGEAGGGRAVAAGGHGPAQDKAGRSGAGGEVSILNIDKCKMNK